MRTVILVKMIINKKEIKMMTRKCKIKAISILILILKGLSMRSIENMKDQPISLSMRIMKESKIEAAVGKAALPVRLAMCQVQALTPSDI
jgi:hypothetical protein